MLNNAPAYQHYANDFLAETAFLSMEGRGVFITLKSYYWVKGSLPNNLRMLARLCVLTEEEFTQIWEREVRELFEQDAEKVWLADLDEQKIFQNEKREKAQKSAEFRWNNANAMRAHNRTQCTSTSTSTSKEETNSIELGENASPSGESISQKPRIAKAGKVVDQRKDHPAIKMVHSFITRYPHKDIWDRIIREIGDKPDVEFFRSCYEIWIGVNGNPMNLQKWLFDTNKSGKQPEIYGKENGNGTGNSNGSKYQARSTDTDNFAKSAEFYNDPNNFAN